MKKLGILVPMVTPCTRTGEVDEAGLRGVCRDMLGAGCHSIFVAGSTGRGPWFARQDRVRICRTVADEVGKDVLLFAGCMAPGLTDMVENARALAEAGAQIAVVTAPGYFNYSQEEVETHLSPVRRPEPAARHDLRYPGFCRDEARPGRDVAAGDPRQHRRFQGFQLRHRPVRADGAPARWRAGLLPAPGQGAPVGRCAGRVGASGFVVSLVQIDPRPFVALYRAAEAGDHARAGAIQRKITELLGVVEGCFARRPETSTLFHLLNYALQARGVCANILLDHEGECPGWLADDARRALEILEEARDL